MKKEYRDLQLNENVKYRRILNEGVADECTWHRDARDRVVQIVEGVGWQIQFDGQLPVRLKQGDTVRILAEEWHRILPGKGDLLLIIKEEAVPGDEVDIAGVDAFDPRFVEDEDDMEEIEPELGNLDNQDMSADMGPEEEDADETPIEPDAALTEIRRMVRIAILESKKKLDPNYLTKDAPEMRDEIRKHAKKRDDDPSAYKSYPKGGWKADYSPAGTRYKTKPSAATKAFHKRFGENDDLEINEEEGMLEELGSSVEKALKHKAEQANAPLGALKTVYRKGLAAWKTGHRPGTSQHQWAMGRVNSFLTGGKARKVDAAQWKSVQKHRKK